ncbi:MAG: hypothetical protein V7K92_03910 [Nostoc sp.]|uniref:hypothetical protein n=1 Tax=Nostoc sp. TaxID=1180 RepID=UPI002FF06819
MPAVVTERLVSILASLRDATRRLDEPQSNHAVPLWGSKLRAASRREVRAKPTRLSFLKKKNILAQTLATDQM